MTRPNDIPEAIYEWAEIFCDEHIHTDDRELVARAFMAGQGVLPTQRFGITEQQREVFEYVVAYAEENSAVPPSIREIAEHFGCSVSKAHGVVTALVERGFLKRLTGRARSIALVERAA